MWKINKVKQKGLSLIEASMVLVLSAVVVAGVMVYYQTAQRNNNLDKLSAEMMHIVSEINGLYAGAAKLDGGTNYTNLDTETVLSSISDLEKVTPDPNSPDYIAIKTPFPDLLLDLHGVKRDPNSPGGIDSLATTADRFAIEILPNPTAKDPQIDKVLCTKLFAINFGSQAEYYMSSGASGISTVSVDKPFSERLALCENLKKDDMLGVVFK